MVDLTGDEDPTDEYGDIGMGDSIGVSVSLGGGISSGEKKSRESNIGDSDNTRDGGKTAGGGIVTCGGLMTSYYSGNAVARRTLLARRRKVVIVTVLTLFSITMALIPICNTPILINIAAEANLGYYFIVQQS
ncbi:hypothetical protein Tco_1562406 [Tanacetum coccineum]